MCLSVRRFMLLAACCVSGESALPAQAIQEEAVSVLSVNELTTEMRRLMLLVMSDLLDEHPEYAASFKVLLKELYPDDEPALRTRVQAKLDGVQGVD